MNENNFTLPFNVEQKEISIQIRRSTYAEILKLNLNDVILSYWHGVYCFFNREYIYVGESTNPGRRLKEHFQDKRLKSSDEILIIHSEHFSKSVIYDLETKLIDHISAEEKLKLLNDKTNQESYDYFLKRQYAPVFEKVWDYFQQIDISNMPIVQIESTDVFKFSPYKSLNREQLFIRDEVIETASRNNASSLEHNIVLISGHPGTGKSILASNLFRELSDKYRVCLTSGTNPIVNSFKRALRLQLSKKPNSKVMRTSELINSRNEFDIVIIDEAHRLIQNNGKGMPGMFSHLQKGDNELDAILRRFKWVIVFYDENQTIHGSDAEIEKILSKFKINQHLRLSEQMRSRSDSYVKSIISFFNGERHLNFQGYDFRIFDSFKEMYVELQRLRSNPNLFVSLLSGYTRKWVSKKDKSKFDFDIEGVRLRWNSTVDNWVQSEPARSLAEVAYYNTIQGMELDYAGVIIGKDLYLDEKGNFQVDTNYMFNNNEKPHSSLGNYDQKLKEFIINRYKVLLTRGVHGTYIYIEDEKLREKFKKYFLN